MPEYKHYVTSSTHTMELPKHHVMLHCICGSHGYGESPKAKDAMYFAVHDLNRHCHPGEDS